MTTRTGGAAILIIFFVLVAGLTGALLYALTQLNSLTVLSAFSTDLAARTPDQVHNIRLAAKQINGESIRPGDEFSLNRVLGPCGMDAGYRRAPAIVAGEMRPEWGGGVCQVSSTLYNAALLAGMDITERHAHSRPVSSVPPGRDATTAFGIADLRFVNTTGSRVRISAGVSGNRLTVRIIGAGRPRERITVSTRTLRAPGSRAKRGYYDSARQGDVVLTYRIRAPRKGQPRQELISKDIYEVER